MSVIIAPIVEGQTEAQCLERLLHRIWNELLGCPTRLQVQPPTIRSRSGLIPSGGIWSEVAVEEALRIASVKLSKPLTTQPDAVPCVLFIMDADDDCPAQLATAFSQLSIKNAFAKASISLVIANRMFENWLVAAAASLAGVNRLPENLSPPADIESCRGAAWIDALLRKAPTGRKYEKTSDALEYVHAMNLVEAQANAPSFAKLIRELVKLTTTLSTQKAIDEDESSPMASRSHSQQS